MGSEKNFKYIIKHLIPKYAYFPLSLMVVINIIAYYGTRIVSKNIPHHSVTTDLDRALPFVSIFVIPYFLAYAQWVIGFIRISHVSRRHCYYILFGEIVTKLMATVVFVAFPTFMVRPYVESRDFCTFLVNVLYIIDTPDNLFPSIHCVESWFCLRGCLGQKSIPLWVKIAMFITTTVVFMSTLLTKQHLVLDLLGAVVMSEISLLIVSAFLKKFYPKNKQ